MKQVDEIMRRAIGESIFPGAVLLAARKEKILFSEAYGLADIFSGRAMERETVFDLASLTKPLATTLAVFALIRDQMLSLDQSLGTIIEGLRGTDKARITVADLLDHSSGLPAWRPYHFGLRRQPTGERKKSLRRLLAAEPVTAAPGAQTVYSDLGFMVLYWVLEEITGMAPERFVEERIYRLLGLDDLFFPMLTGKRSRADFAATELCPWRNRLLCGQVHDDNAWSLGGGGGHAGLFGTARAVHRLLVAVGEGFNGENDFFPQTLLRRFAVPRRPGARPLGFDAPSGENSSAGGLFPRQGLGHLGFTGTSFWMDPESGVHIVLLTNRVHPSRYNIKLRRFRPVLHDSIMAALTD